MKIKPQILCALTEWKDTVGTRGRASGKKMSERVILAADKYNWILATEKQDNQGVLIDKSYLGSIRSVLKNLPTEENVQKMIDTIIGSLVERTGIVAKLQMDNPYKDLERLGRWIDDSFRTSYHRDVNNTRFYEIFQLGSDLEEDDG